MPRNENRKLQAANCLACGTEFRARPHDINHRNRKFCSPRCSTGGRFNGNFKGEAKSWYDRKKESVARHPARHKCRRKFEYALSQRRITKQPCFICGADKVEGHHWDYTRPFDVFWLCRLHHVHVHNGKIVLPLPDTPIDPAVGQPHA